VCAEDDVDASGDYRALEVEADLWPRQEQAR
jgi:hypothetical protein